MFPHSLWTQFLSTSSFANPAVFLLEESQPDTVTSAGAEDESRSGGDCLDRAGEKQGYTPRDVAEVRLLLRLLPVFLLMMSYFTVYTHMFSLFVLQVRRTLRPLLPATCMSCPRYACACTVPQNCHIE